MPSLKIGTIGRNIVFFTLVWYAIHPNWYQEGWRDAPKGDIVKSATEFAALLRKNWA